MANTSSAQKAQRQSEKRRIANVARKSALKTSIKKLIVSIEQNGDIEQMQGLLSSVAAQLARARSKDVMKPNTASRTLSRLAKKVAARQRAAKA